MHVSLVTRCADQSEVYISTSEKDSALIAVSDDGVLHFQAAAEQGGPQRSWPIQSASLRLASAAAFRAESSTYAVLAKGTGTQKHRLMAWDASYTGSLASAPVAVPVPLRPGAYVIALLALPGPTPRHSFLLALSDASVLGLRVDEACSPAVDIIHTLTNCTTITATLDRANIVWVVMQQQQQQQDRVPGDALSTSVQSPPSIPSSYRVLSMDTKGGSAPLSTPLAPPSSDSRELTAAAPTRDLLTCFWASGDVSFHRHGGSAGGAAHAVLRLRTPLPTAPPAALDAAQPMPPSKRRRGSGGGAQSTVASAPSVASLCLVAAVSISPVAVVLVAPGLLPGSGGGLCAVTLDAVHGTVTSAEALELSDGPLSAHARVALTASGAHTGVPTLLVLADSAVCAARCGSRMASGLLSDAVGSLAVHTGRCVPAAAAAVLAPQCLPGNSQAEPVFPLTLDAPHALPSDADDPEQASATASGAIGGMSMLTEVPAPAPMLRPSDNTALLELAARLQKFVQNAGSAADLALPSGAEGMQPSAVALPRSITERAAARLAALGAWEELSALCALTRFRDLAQCPGLLKSATDAGQFALVATLLRGEPVLTPTDVAGALCSILSPAPTDSRATAPWLQAHHTLRAALADEASANCAAAEKSHHARRVRAAAAALAALDGFPLGMLPLHVLIACRLDAEHCSHACAGLPSAAVPSLARYLICWLIKLLAAGTPIATARSGYRLQSSAVPSVPQVAMWLEALLDRRLPEVIACKPLQAALEQVRASVRAQIALSKDWLTVSSGLHHVAKTYMGSGGARQREVWTAEVLELTEPEALVQG